MNHYLRRCVEEFEQVAREIGLLPALLFATLIIFMTALGSIIVMILVAIVLALSPLALAIIWVASFQSRSCRKGAVGMKPVTSDPWFSE